MNLKNIKIRVPEGRSWEEVVEYLESLGYAPSGNLEFYKNRKFFTGCDHGQYYFVNTPSVFNEHQNEEIFLPEKELEKAPPIGLRPKAIVDALRIQEILEAMTRYAADGKAIPQDWIDELSIRNSERVDYAG